jgi:radical SAM protein with 4Fe4S-binding SPASM domain
MCSQVDFRPRPRHIDDILFQRIEPILGNLKTLNIGGGEPTIMPGARRLLEWVTAHYPQISLESTTNGLCFAGIWEDAFLAQGALLNISLGTANPATYARMVQFGDFPRVAAMISRLVRRRNDQSSALRLRISSVVVDDTIHEMAPFIEWAADHGVDRVLFVTDQIGGIKRYTPDEVRAFISEAYAAVDRLPQLTVTGLTDFDAYYARTHGISPVRSVAVGSPPTSSCQIPLHGLHVNPYGYAYPCPSTSYYFGNLVRQPLEDVWNSRAAQVFRARIAAMDFRDCLPSCGSNACPVHPLYFESRKALWIARRDPLHVIQKGLRRFGLTNARSKRPATANKNTKDPITESN